MTSYRGTAEGPDRTKAVIAVILVHAAVGFMIVSGLEVGFVRHSAETLTTIRVRDVAPPPPRPAVIRPTKSASIAKVAQQVPAEAVATAATAAANPQADPAEPASSSPPTATQTGSLAGAGSSRSGEVTAGGMMGDLEAAGGVDFSRFTPARLIANIPNDEYRRLSSTGIPSGLVGVLILVGPSGTASNCRVARSSGDRQIDALVCELTLRYVRFDPARDAAGRPVAQDITYFPSWRRR